jgi:hypothetical protein
MLVMIGVILLEVFFLLLEVKLGLEEVSVLVAIASQDGGVQCHQAATHGHSGGLGASSSHRLNLTAESSNIHSGEAFEL